MSRALIPALLSFLCLTGSLDAAERILRDVAYHTDHGQPLRLDLAVPPATGRKPPLVVFLHGGGFIGGDKKDWHGAAMEFCRQGYAAASVGYGNCPFFTVPQQVAHLRTALAYLQQHAEELGFDAARIGLLGASAGGYLVLMAGLAEPEICPAQGDLPPVAPGAIRAIVDLYGPTDLLAYRGTGMMQTMYGQHPGFENRSEEQILLQLTGAASLSDPLLPGLCVLNHVGAQKPPVLILHGSEDALVPLAQSRNLYDRMQQAQARGTLAVLAGQGHGFSGEAARHVWPQILAFFTKELQY